MMNFKCDDKNYGTMKEMRRNETQIVAMMFGK
jgi:hypothetical protein